jgi:hypothetical protein
MNYSHMIYVAIISMFVAAVPAHAMEQRYDYKRTTDRRQKDNELTDRQRSLTAEESQIQPTDTHLTPEEVQRFKEETERKKNRKNKSSGSDLQ